MQKPVDYLTGEDVTLYKGLGPVYFQPKTISMSALAHFQLGLLLLHVFWYDKAADQFRVAQQKDPRMAMAYFGEAMCYKQPLWQTEDLGAAAKVFARYDRVFPDKTKVPENEAAYMEAARIYFNPALTLQQREQGFTDAMQARMDATRDDDPDACAFYALALLGETRSKGGYLTPEQARDKNLRARLKLEECSDPSMRGTPGFFPDYTAMWHYMVNTYDVAWFDPATELAPAIFAADQLSLLAPASNRAQHMHSHITMRVGNWTDVVEYNKVAVAASDKFCAVEAANAPSCDADNRYHSLEWQLYGNTQRCAFNGKGAAAEQLARMQKASAAMGYTGDYVQWQYRMYAHMQLQSMGWLGAVGLNNATDNAPTMLPAPLYDTTADLTAGVNQDHFWPPHAEAYALLARLSALVWNRTAADQLAAANTVNSALARLGAIVKAQQDRADASVLSAANVSDSAAANAEMAKLLAAVQLQAQALVFASHCISGANATACSEWAPLMDAALVLHNVTKDSPTLPTLKIAPIPEMYGNLLLAVPTPDAATALLLFQQCVQELPGRMQCVYGVARAAEMAAGTQELSGPAYALLLQQCGAAGDAAFPPLVRARQVLGAYPPPSPPPPQRRGGRRMAAL